MSWDFNMEGSGVKFTQFRVTMSENKTISDNLHFVVVRVRAVNGTLPHQYTGHIH